MTNLPPKDPEVDDPWVNDAGELLRFDGTDWVPYEDLPFIDTGVTYKDT
jgi:hypothetical protein